VWRALDTIDDKLNAGLKLTGATQASRYVGATATGAPSSGTWAVGDWLIAQDGVVWICTVAGSQGTWVAAATTSNLYLPLAGGTVTGTAKFTAAPVIKVNSAPTDGSLAAGEAALWFDSTNGAGKLMVKAKQADGTVKTGTLAVAT
jgi:hypothetical protein